MPLSEEYVVIDLELFDFFILLLLNIDQQTIVSLFAFQNRQTMLSGDDDSRRFQLDTPQRKH